MKMQTAWKGDTKKEQAAANQKDDLSERRQ